MKIMKKDDNKDKLNFLQNLHNKLYPKDNSYEDLHKKENEKYFKNIAPIKQQQKAKLEEETLKHNILRAFRKSIEEGLKFLVDLYLKEIKEEKLIKQQEDAVTRKLNEEIYLSFRDEIDKASEKAEQQPLITQNAINYYDLQAKDLAVTINYISDVIKDFRKDIKSLEEDMKQCDSEDQIEEKINKVAAIKQDEKKHRNIKTRLIIHKEYSEKMQDISERKKLLEEKSKITNNQEELNKIKNELNKLNIEKTKVQKDLKDQVGEENYKDDKQKLLQANTGMREGKFEAIKMKFEDPKHGEYYQNIIDKKTNEINKQEKSIDMEQSEKLIEKIESLQKKNNYIFDQREQKLENVLKELEKFNENSAYFSNIAEIKGRLEVEIKNKLVKDYLDLEKEIEGLRKNYTESSYSDNVQKYTELSNKITQTYHIYNEIEKEIKSEINKIAKLESISQKPDKPKL